MAEEEILREIADLLAKPKSRGEMIGEFLREVAVLLMVFAPLEALFSPAALGWWEIVGLMGFAVGLGYLGLRIEERRE